MRQRASCLGQTHPFAIVISGATLFPHSVATLLNLLLLENSRLLFSLAVLRSLQARWSVVSPNRCPSPHFPRCRTADAAQQSFSSRLQHRATQPIARTIKLDSVLSGMRYHYLDEAALPTCSHAISPASRPHRPPQRLYVTGTSSSHLTGKMLNFLRMLPRATPEILSCVAQLKTTFQPLTPAW